MVRFLGIGVPRFAKSSTSHDTTKAACSKNKREKTRRRRTRPDRSRGPTGSLKRLRTTKRDNLNAPVDPAVSTSCSAFFLSFFLSLVTKHYLNHRKPRDRNDSPISVQQNKSTHTEVSGW